MAAGFDRGGESGERDAEGHGGACANFRSSIHTRLENVKRQGLRRDLGGSGLGNSGLGNSGVHLESQILNLTSLRGLRLIACGSEAAPFNFESCNFSADP